MPLGDGRGEEKMNPDRYVVSCVVLNAISICVTDCCLLELSLTLLKV